MTALAALALMQRGVLLVRTSLAVLVRAGVGMNQPRMQPRR